MTASLRVHVTPALDLLTDALAVHRLTRLVVEDDITEPLRDRLIEAAYNLAGRPLPEGWEGQSLTERAANDAHAPKLATLWVCPYCVSVWAGLGVVVVRRFRWWRGGVGDALALAAVAVWLKRMEP